jgi:Na+/proline symporter
VTVAMAGLGVAAAPLVGLSVTIWYYLQNISAYLSVPMSAAIFTGLLWKRATVKGAITSVTVGFCAGLVCFLDQTLRWSLPLLSSPYLNSFLHRSLLVWIISAVTMVAVSLATQAADDPCIKEHTFRGDTQPWKGPRDYRAWAIVLLICTLVLWWSFR